MFGINWHDPQTLWLNLTNVALGVVTLLALAIVAGAVAWELVLKHRRERSLSGIDTELRAMLGAGTPHSLHVPELGLTMADGGMPVKPSTAKPTEQKPAGK